MGDLSQERNDSMMSRSDAIQTAVLRELKLRRSWLDASQDIVSVTITVRLQAGPEPVRSVIFEDHRVVARRPMGAKPLTD